MLKLDVRILIASNSRRHWSFLFAISEIWGHIPCVKSRTRMLSVPCPRVVLISPSTKNRRRWKPLG